MQYLVILLLVVLAFVIKSVYDEKAYRTRMVKRLKAEWGAIPGEEYTSEKLMSIESFYRSHTDNDTDVDDITWNDIDMDRIFMLLNNTSSAIGEEYLYYILRKPQFEQKKLLERNRLIELFQTEENKRIELQFALSRMGKLKNLSLYEYINRANDIKRESNLKHCISAFGLLASIGSIFVYAPTGAVLTLGFLAYNILSYYKRKAEIEKYFSVFAYILRLLNSVKSISDLDIPEINEYKNKLKELSQSFQKFKRGSWLVTGGSMNGDLADTLMDYVRMLFHVDLIKFNSMLSEFQRNKKKLNQIYETIGILDTMIAAASFRALMGNKYCLPELEKKRKPFLKVDKVYHPMINEPVPNTISEEKCILITGSNASGKSTFIKTIAINAILAQTVYTSLSESYHASFFKIYSSMALRDDILSNESYYIVEIKSLKRILDRINGDIPMLCFVDEVLRGTNTLERIAASSQILKSFAKSNSLCFAATHDIELTYILKKEYSNYHFQEQIADNNIIFDYQLLKGRAVSRNAIKLLGIIGYQDSIIEQATNEANNFMETGVWNEI